MNDYYGTFMSHSHITLPQVKLTNYKLRKFLSKFNEEGHYLKLYSIYICLSWNFIENAHVRYMQIMLSAND